MTEIGTDIVVSTTSARAALDGMSKGQLSVWSTFAGESHKDKIELFQAMTAAEPISDHLGEVINLNNVVAQVVEVENQDGLMVEAVRVILVSDDDKAYAGLSDGLFRSIQNLFGVLGMPNEWDAALPVVVTEEKSRKGFKFFTLKIA